MADQLPDVASENSETKTIDNKTTSASDKPAASKRSRSETPPKAKTGLLWFVVLLNFLLICGLAGGGFWFWQQYQAKLSNDQAVETRVSDMGVQLNAQQANLQKTINASLQRNADVVASLKAEMDTLAQQSESNARRLSDLSGRRPSDWLLAEADYLVRMAGRKLWLENDVRTAILMMESADARLQDMADPSLLTVRQYIANDLQVLGQINTVSNVNIALALSAIVKQVDGLPLALPDIPNPVDHNAELSGDIADAGSNLQKTLAFFKDLFQYRPKDAPVRPLLSSQQQWLAKEQLKLALLQAQSAALVYEGTLYQQSLQTAISLLVDHFDLEQQGVVQFTDSLRNLEQTDLNRALPQELQSARPLRDLLTERVSAAHQNKAFEL